MTNAADSRLSGLDRFFKITQRGSTVGTEIRGGLTTFLAMAYIIVLNPILIGAAADSTGAFLGGGDTPNLAAVAAATSLISGLLTLLMGLVGNFPMAVSSALGMSAFMAFGVVVIPGMTWADAMGLVVIEGIILLLLVVTGFRTAIFNAVPGQLKSAIGVGIGFFIALIGMINAGFISNSGGTALELGRGGSIASWPVLLFTVALLLLFVLYAWGVRAAILYTILIATAIAFALEAVFNLGPKTGADGEVANPGGWGLTVPKIEGGWFHSPDLSILGSFNLLGSFQSVGIITAVLVVFTLLLTNFFDLLGTMMAVGTQAKLVDESGQVEGAKRIMVADALGAIVGGLGGTSSNSGFVESTVGVGSGARTGLANVVTGALFLLTVFLAPLAALIPSEAAAPTLVFVGFLMMQQVVRINWTDIEIAVPAFLTIVLMPFSYSITNGIGAGFVSYVVLKTARGKFREVHPLMYLTAALFIVYFASGPIQALVAG